MAWLPYRVKLIIGSEQVGVPQSSWFYGESGNKNNISDT